MDATKSRTRKQLYDYLEKNCLVQKGSNFTHTSIYDPMASYYISPEKNERFVELYSNAVQCGVDLYLTEKHRDIGPFVIDLDFRFQYTEGEEVERRYTEENVQSILEIYAKCISEFVEDDTTKFSFYVMEKPSPVLFKGLVKDGIHIVIPNVVTRPVFQMMIRERLLGPIAEVLKDIGLVNPITDVVDEAVIERNNWQMYGSKKPHLEKYVVTHIYEYDKTVSKLVPTNVRLEDPEYINVLSIRNKYVETKLKFEKSEDLKKYEELVQAKKMRAHFKNSVLSKTKNTQLNKIESEEEFNRISELVDLLSVERAETYNDWIRVGWCLRNIDFRLLTKWVTFSKLSRKFVAGECEKQWDYMRQDGACLGKGTLHLWAKQDDPERYSQIVQEDLRRLIWNAKGGTEYDVALVVQQMYDHKYIYDSRNKTWYEFKNHRWHQTDEGFALKKKLPTAVADAFRNSVTFHSARAANITDAEEKDRLDALIKKLTEVISRLKRAAFQNNVMTECAMLFQVDKIDEKLDTNTHLIGFENGVYDLDALEFREGRPEDYITMTTGINYNPYDDNHPFIHEIKAFFSQVIRVDAVREYVYGLFASFLHGNIREERFHVWTGVGCFAKDTKVLMYDGKTKKIQDIQVGDIVMGDDSTPRNVLKLYRGHSDMYEIVPEKGDPFTVNGDHDLAVIATDISTNRGKHVLNWVEYGDEDMFLKTHSKDFTSSEERDRFKTSIENNNKIVKKGDKLIINMRQFLKLGPEVHRFLHLYRTGVEFNNVENVPIDPYIFGYWLGDRTSSVDRDLGHHHAELKKLGVINNKHIPDAYKNNSREVRMEVLAGLIDRDGHYQKEGNQFVITVESEKLMDDVISLARSLGFACYKHEKNAKSETCWRINIFGKGIETIPTKLNRKIATVRNCPRDPLVVSFKTRRVQDDDFFGFELDKNNLFVMGDTFTVQKNSNGKSKALELYQKAFGEYCCTLPIALLTQKRGASSSASPELARARTKRFACLQEPGENERLNIGLMKEMTGGDKLYARGLYKEGGDFKPQFKMLLTCNHLPLVPSDDGGTWRRIRVVRFESRFCDHPDPSKPNEFPMDTNLSTKFDDWKEPFMSLLIEYYKKIMTQKTKEPEEVMECTREYQRRNDIIMDFLDNSVEKSENGFLSVTDAFVEFKNWLKEEGVMDRTMRKGDFQNYIEKKYGKAVKKKMLKGWNGFRLRSSVVDYPQDDYD